MFKKMFNLPTSAVVAYVHPLVCHQIVKERLNTQSVEEGANRLTKSWAPS